MFSADILEKARNGDLYSALSLGVDYSEGNGVAIDFDEAKKWLEIALATDNSVAYGYLGDIYFYGKGHCERNPSKGIELYQKSVEKAANDSWLEIHAAVLGKAYIEDTECRNYEKGIFYLKKAGELGSGSSNNELGTLYFNGIEGKLQKDLPTAFLYYQKAADEGCDVGAFNLARCYRHGYGVEQNQQEAMKWYLKSEEWGYPLATFIIAEMTRRGEAVEADLQKAIEIFQRYLENPDEERQGVLRALIEIAFCYSQLGDQYNAFKYSYRAAEENDVDSQMNVAFAYLKGEAVQQDAEKAVYWLTRAAQNGDPEAMRRLGGIYMYGNYGIPIDEKKGFIFYKQGAEASDSQAQLGVADAYRFGNGTAIDKLTALNWYKAAGDNGEPLALFCLAEMYNNGEGVSEDYPLSISYYRQYLESGDNNYIPQAYCGIGVAAYYLNDMQSAYAFLNKAAELGDERAKEILQQI